MYQTFARSVKIKRWKSICEKLESLSKRPEDKAFWRGMKNLFHEEPGDKRMTKVKVQTTIEKEEKNAKDKGRK